MLFVSCVSRKSVSVFVRLHSVSRCACTACVSALRLSAAVSCVSALPSPASRSACGACVSVVDVRLLRLSLCFPSVSTVVPSSAPTSKPRGALIFFFQVLCVHPALHPSSKPSPLLSPNQVARRLSRLCVNDGAHGVDRRRRPAGPDARPRWYVAGSVSGVLWLTCGEIRWAYARPRLQRRAAVLAALPAPAASLAAPAAAPTVAHAPTALVRAMRRAQARSIDRPA